MKIGYRRRLADFAGGLRLQREFAKHERQPREELSLRFNPEGFCDELYVRRKTPRVRPLHRLRQPS
jgi:hypothetical protein